MIEHLIQNALNAVFISLFFSPQNISVTYQFFSFGNFYKFKIISKTFNSSALFFLFFFFTSFYFLPSVTMGRLSFFMYIWIFLPSLPLHDCQVALHTLFTWLASSLVRLSSCVTPVRSYLCRLELEESHHQHVPTFLPMVRILSYMSNPCLPPEYELLEGKDYGLIMHVVPMLSSHYTQ